jgi:hypothetical protein
MKTAIASLVIILLLQSAVLPCTCANTSGLKQIQQRKLIRDSEAIFYGEVIAVGEPRTVVYNSGNLYSTPVTLRVIRSWKGVSRDEITIDTDTTSSCGLSPSVGRRLTLFPHRSKMSGQLFANLCSRNLLETEVLQRELGPGTEFSPAKSTQTMSGFFARIWAALVSTFS